MQVFLGSERTDPASKARMESHLAQYTVHLSIFGFSFIFIPFANQRSLYRKQESVGFLLEALRMFQAENQALKVLRKPDLTT